MSPRQRQIVRVVCCLSTLVLLDGCVLPAQISRLQKDVADMQQRLARIQSKHSESWEKLVEIETKLEDGEGVTRAEFADLKLQLDDISRQVAVLDERVNDAHRRMDRVSQDVQETREVARALAHSVPPERPAEAGSEAEPPAPSGGPVVPEAVPSPEALYNTAYTDFSKGNYALAISGFEEYASRFPESDLADNALYWVGECHFSQGNFPVAVEAFDRMLERYPESDRAAASNLKKGLAYLELNQVSQAIVQLRYVVSSFPRSDEARIARDKLASLGAAGR